MSLKHTSNGLADTADLISVDPTVQGVQSPTGTWAYRADPGVLYFKYGDAPTAWVPIAVGPSLKAGVNLTNANATINPASDKVSLYTLPKLSSNGVLTLGVAGSPITNSTVQILRRDLGSSTYTVQDDVGSVLHVFEASPARPEGAVFYYTGLHYQFLDFFYSV